MKSSKPTTEFWTVLTMVNFLVLLCYKLNTCNTKDLHRQPL